MSTQTVALADLDQQLAELVDQVRKSSDRLVITDQGQAEAVLLSAEDFDGLLETLEILSDTALVARLVEAEAEFSAGGGRSLDEVLEKLKNGRRQALRSS